MNEKIRTFDTEAATWDEKPRRMKLVADIFTTIQKNVVLHDKMDVLDFGCGTGVLAMHMLPLVGSITGVDTSRGMLNVFEEKVAKKGLDTIKTVLISPDGYESIQGQYDLIVSTMTLHHIERIAPLLEHFRDILVPGGCLAIADLDLDDGVFHSKEEDVFHDGFDREDLCKVFEEAGFENLQQATAAETTKTASNGEMRRFSLFLITGSRP
ncbi:MAG: class I SAM-dependent methyltransferase [Candidatus Hydrogenedentes bacterium]|nr:class I SAM-dependent methyltransferase [Candidatus Hydrogenedentota bacterium]